MSLLRLTTLLCRSFHPCTPGATAYVVPYGEPLGLDVAHGGMCSLGHWGPSYTEEILHRTSDSLLLLHWRMRQQDSQGATDPHADRQEQC
jgi:hypothetical protein